MSVGDSVLVGSPYKGEMALIMIPSCNSFSLSIGQPYLLYYTQCFFSHDLIYILYKYVICIS